MLFTLIVVLFALWLLGFSMSIGGSLIHALLIIAAVLVLYSFLSRRRRLV